MKDRFSLHVDDGQPEILEAFTVLRNGFTVGSPDGLVGITNITHSDSEPPILPETILNTQSEKKSSIRFSSRGYYDSAIELLGNGNSKASGLLISYSPGSRKADFSQIFPDGCTGKEIGFLSAHSNNFVGIGTTKFNASTKFTPNSPLTIWHSGTTNSGTVALKEQASSPSPNSSFGKIFVKPISSTKQSLFFLDDAGVEYNLTHPHDGDGDAGNLKTDELQNTFGGKFAPYSSYGLLHNTQVAQNTLLGFSAGFKLSTGDRNTVIGCNAGSGLIDGSNNTIFGSFNATNVDTDNMVILGQYNLTPELILNSDNQTPPQSLKNNILIGSGLARDLDIDPFTMLIGFGEHPLVRAGLGTTSERFFSVDSAGFQKAKLSVTSSDNVFSLTDSTELTDHIGVANIGILEFQDLRASLQHRGMASMRFVNQFSQEQTLVDFVPSGLIPNPTPSFTKPASPTPFMAVSGDLYVNGCIRFSDETVLCGAGDRNLFADSGIKKNVESTRSTFTLDYTNLNFADSLTPSVDAGLSYLSLEVPSGSVRKVGKISIQGLANYVSSGHASVAENCNLVWSDITSENRIDTINNSGTVFIGCEVGVESTGWKNSIFIGQQAGAYSTVANTSLATDTAPIFIGYQAGYDSDDLDNTIAIGTAAGKNADESADSIFIGSSAGLNASGNRNSIGIGENALNGLDTPGHDSLGGNKNIEIITGLDNDERLLYSSGNLNSRINIQNIIAGDHSKKFISLGDARVSPIYPVESRKDDTLSTAHNDTDVIHGWFNNNSNVGFVDSSGDYRTIHGDAGGIEAWFGSYEGFVTEQINAPSSYSSPTSGLMRTQTHRNNFGTDNLIWVTNRDPKLVIHGPGSDGGAAFVVTARVNGENRPVYISCSGDGS